MKSFLNFLHQISYYKVTYLIFFSVRDHKNATQCVSSYLLSNPKDQNMINNKEYYINELGMQDSEFMPRSEALSYYRQIRNEQKLLDFINTNFTFDKKVKCKSESCQIIEKLNC